MTLKNQVFKIFRFFFHFWHIQPIFVLLKVSRLATLFDRKLFKFSNTCQNGPFFGIFYQFLSSQYVNFARFKIFEFWRQKYIQKSIENLNLGAKNQH